MAVLRVISGYSELIPFSILKSYLSKQAIKPHVPLIKFRKGASPSTRTHGKEAAQPSTGGSGRSGTAARSTIEDHQLPAKYRRQPLDEKEIDYINRGGPE